MTLGSLVFPLRASTAPANVSSAVRRVALRFVFLYLLLYLLPYPLVALPGTKWLHAVCNAPWPPMAVWTADHLLRLAHPLDLGTLGSNDTLYDYVKLLCRTGVAASVAAVWSALDRKRASDEVTYHALRVFLRYSLGVILLQYGVVKLLKTQFLFPCPQDLVTPIGEVSPQHLLWTFMGYSTPYNWFTGGAEVAGALLLFFRRTTTLGALLLVTVLANVVMLNFSYDVPVKLFSMHLLASAVLLVIPDARRLADVLVFHRPTVPAPDAIGASLAAFPRADRWLAVARVAFIACAIHSQAKPALAQRAEYGDDAPKPAFYGAWAVESFARNGEEIAPLEPSRWQTVAVNSHGVTVRTNARDMVVYRRSDESARLVLTGRKDKSDTLSLAATQPDPEHLVLEGPSAHGAVTVRLRRLPMNEMPLIARGFRWVTESPFGR